MGSLFLLDLWKRRPGSGSVEASGPYAIRVTAASAFPEPALPEPPDEDALERFLLKRLDGLTKLVSAGPLKRAVPKELMLEFVRRASGLDEVAAFLRGVRLQALENRSGEQLAVIRGL